MKERLSITIDKDLLDWIDLKVSQKVFGNRSHALEYLVLEMMNQDNAAAKHPSSLPALHNSAFLGDSQ